MNKETTPTTTQVTQQEKVECIAAAPGWWAVFVDGRRPVALWTCRASSSGSVRGLPMVPAGTGIVAAPELPGYMGVAHSPDAETELRRRFALREQAKVGVTINQALR